MNVQYSRRIIQCISIIGILATIVGVYFLLTSGILSNPKTLESLLGGSAILGPILFILIQIIQVVIPIIPGGVSTAVGVLVFGPVWGFIYNYLGIVIGSIIIFLLGRCYGKPFILSFVSNKTYEKYSQWLNNDKRFERLFTLAIFSPVSPADALCLIAGLSKLSLKRFSTIIILAKPASIFLYSLLLVHGGDTLSSWMGY